MDSDHSEARGQSTPTQKFMRYRSLRKNAPKVPEPSSRPPMPQPDQTPLKRLPSRYRRANRPAAEAPPLPTSPHVFVALDHAPSPETTAQPHFTADVPVEDDRVRIESTGSRRVVIGNGARQSDGQPRSRDEPIAATSGAQEEQMRTSLEIAREEARLILEGKDDHVRALRRAETERRQRRLENEVRGAIQENRARDIRSEAPQRLCSRDEEYAHPIQHATHERDSGRDMPPRSEKPKSRTLVIGGQSHPDPDRYHRRASSSVAPPQKPSLNHSRSISVGRTEKTHMSSPPGVMPQHDVPISAVNAGERRVKIRCKDTSLTIPITPSTTCRDVLKYAARHMREAIDVHSAVVVESFSQLGLERPIRRYERIRDILNSWDSDERHTLLIRPGSTCTTLDLRESGAPRQQPVGGTVQLYHSQKPGKWDKRWIQLRNDGQVTVSKNGTDFTNICHLSDFDLYDLTEAQVKTLKPPRKVCFALKSQQKPSMFLEGANYVHFFCHKDQAIVLPWYHAVHSWRSWYLFNIVGDRERQPTPPSADSSSSRPSTSRSKESLPTVPVSLRPLLDCPPLPSTERTCWKDSDAAAGRPSQSDGSRPLIDLVSKTSTFEGKPSSPRHSKGNSAPPNAFPRGLLQEAAAAARPGSADAVEERPFTGTGLLARSASRRSGHGNVAGGGGGAGTEGNKPLIDLHPTSEFTDGSLLRKLEAIAGPQVQPGPKIDRQKEGREITVPIGEGFD